MNRPSLRSARASDAPFVLSLFADHLRELGCLPDAQLDEDMRGFPAAYTSHEARFLVAEDHQERIVGMGGILEGELRRLFVAPESRGRGVATQIVHELVRLHGPAACRRLTASVARKNHRGIDLLIRCGFIRTGRRPEHPAASHCEVFECHLPAC